MNEPIDLELLRRFAGDADDRMFSEIVTRHVDFVYSAARRMVVDPHLAEDVTQSVFTELARQAASISTRVAAGMPLSAWLHVTTRNLSAKLVRTEERRRARELQATAMTPQSRDPGDAAWHQLAPQLDGALAQLPDTDRDALLLRFFERQTARDIGIRLGIGEEAAQKRITRAIDKLRQVLATRGISIQSATLAGTIGTHAVQVAPAGLATSVGSAALAGVATAAAGKLFLMSTTKLVAGIASIVTAGLAAGLVLQHRELAQVRGQLERATAAPVAEPVALPTAESTAPPDSPLREEAVRLRGEVAQLRRERDELRKRLASLTTKPNLRSQSTTAPSGTTPTEEELEEAKAAGIRRLNHARHWGLAFLLFAGDNRGRLPKSFEDAQPYVGQAPDSPTLDPEQFEIVFTGALNEIANPARAIVLREREGFTTPGKPGLSRTYLFADGHSEIRYSENGDFTTWEQERVAVLQTAPAGGQQ